MVEVLRGRDPELAAARQQLADARAGDGGALAILAEPGMGKTAMLAAVAELAGAEFTHVGVHGVRSESALEFAGLQRLLAPLREHIPRLPEHQAEALAAVLAGCGPTGKPLVVGTAVVALLAEAAGRGPVLCWADDAHWLDRASLNAMTFAARRLGPAPVVMLFAAREENPARDDLAGITRLPLPALDATASRQTLADRRPGEIADGLAAELAELAGGNPLALVELAAALTPDQLSGEEPPPERLPVDSRLRAAYRLRFSALPPDGRRLVLLATADDRLDRATLARAAEEGGLDLGELESALTSGLLRAGGETIGVPSPVLRSSLYADAPLAERRAAHDLLAHVMDDERQRARRVWHQAALADAPDEKLGAELCTAAEEASAAGAYAESARAWERAAELAADRNDRVTRLLAAAKDAWLGGRSRQARALLRRLLPLIPDGPLRGLADLLRGEIEVRDGTPASGRWILLAAADRLVSTDRRTAVDALAGAAEACSAGGDLRQFLLVAERLAKLRRRRESPDLALVFAGVEGIAATYRRRYPDAVGPLRRAVELADRTGDCAAKVWAGISALLLGEDLRACELATEAVVLGDGADGPGRPWALMFLAIAEFWLGRYESATEHSVEGVRRARALGQENSAADHLAFLALIAAQRGDKETALRRLAAVPDSAARRGLARAGAFTVWARACVDLVEDRPTAAASRIRLMGGTGHAHPLVQLMATPHFVEAAVRCDERREALVALEAFRHWAASTGNAARLALAERCHALVAEDDAEADAHFREALRLHRRGTSAFELARTELMYGNLLRRLRKPRAAREHLRSALQIFEHYEAAYWIDGARAELRAAGEAVEDATITTADSLTAQQLQIARLAADGATNREIADRLVISHRTVEHHLRNVFVRLGIRSRVELPRFFR